MKAKIRKQAQEISYIAIRLGQLTNNQELADRIERSCLSIIESVYGQKYIDALERIEVLEGIVAYGVNTSQIRIENGEELIRRSSALKDLLIEGQTNIEEKFRFETKLALLPEPHKIDSTSAGSNTTRQSGKASKNKLPYDNKPNSPKAERRQSKIVNLLKERGKMQLKDIVSAFPNISERTIRYDLTHLCNTKRLIREGNGGPANFYMLPSSIETSKMEPNINEKLISSATNLPEEPPFFDSQEETPFGKSELNEALNS